MLDSLPVAMFEGKSGLQFSEDPRFPRERLGKVDVSTFEGKNSLDVCEIDLPDISYDWIIANHVLEHVRDDKRAVKELLRVVKPDEFL